MSDLMHCDHQGGVMIVIFTPERRAQQTDDHRDYDGYPDPYLRRWSRHSTSEVRREAFTGDG